MFAEMWQWLKNGSGWVAVGGSGWQWLAVVKLAILAGWQWLNSSKKNTGFRMSPK
jgi:hypothetical protein